MDCDEEARKRHNDTMTDYRVVSGTALVKLAKKVRFDITCDKENVKFSVSEFLIKAGVPAHLKGYQYLREAIVMTVIDINTIDAVTKKLYPAIAKKYKTTSASVERAIRHAIQITWFREEYGGPWESPSVMVGIFKSKPTNSYFIAEIAEKIRLEHLGNSTDD